MLYKLANHRRAVSKNAKNISYKIFYIQKIMTKKNSKKHPNNSKKYVVSSFSTNTYIKTNLQ